MNTHTKHKKILVTGADGQLGKALQNECKLYPELTLVFATKHELDITETLSIDKAIQVHQPDVIVNTAAYTAVDAAENDQEAAYLLNDKAVGLLTASCKQNDIVFIHISTDYVFDGTSKEAYTEISQVNPQTVYGASKLAGEKAVQAVDGLVYVIIRTSWLYSNYGHNFYKTMLRLGTEKSELRVVDDQFGIPTLANDLAIAILEIAPKLDATNKGIYHYSNQGKATWYAFAKAIFKVSKLDVLVTPLVSESYPTAAKRPKNSELNCEKITSNFGVNRPFWKDALLSNFVKKMNN